MTNPEQMRDLMEMFGKDKDSARQAWKDLEEGIATIRYAYNQASIPHMKGNADNTQMLRDMSEQVYELLRMIDKKNDELGLDRGQMDMHNHPESWGPKK